MRKNRLAQLLTDRRSCCHKVHTTTSLDSPPLDKDIRGGVGPGQSSILFGLGGVGGGAHQE